ncbi:MAG: RNA polymerase sigma-70 factor [Bacteroidota bacterium]
MSIFSQPKLDIRSESGFTILYDQYGEFVFRICYRYLEDADASHNITADIFISIWERRDTLHQETWGKYSWKRYLSQAAKHQVFDHLRIKKQLDLYFSRTSYKIRPFSNSTEEDVAFEELASQIDNLIDALPPKRKEVFRLSREKGQSNKEIADRLSISINSVKTHITKAIKHLRDNLSEYNLANRSTGS